MPELREAVKKRVIDALDQTDFTASDFKVEFGDDNSNLMFVAVFLHDESNYKYEVSRAQSERGDDYFVEETPGEFEIVQYTEIPDFGAVLDRIRLWATEVRLELVAKRPEYRELDKLRAAIEESLNHSVNSEDPEFSVEELNKLQKMFNSLEKRVTELEENNQITKAMKEEISKSIEQVSNDMDDYLKQTWLKTTVNKLSKTVSTVGTSKEGRAILSDGVRKLLGLE